LPQEQEKGRKTLADQLVHIIDDAIHLIPSGDLSLVVVLNGFLDAGNAPVLVADHLERIGEGSVVATFDVDQFHDYRARRPAMTFKRDHHEDYDTPRLTVRLLQDSAGTPFLLLRGPEPDHRWEAFVRGVMHVIEQLKVTRTITLGAVPMAVPHTRPMTVTPHATRPELIIGTPMWDADLRIPSSVQSLLQLRLGEVDRAGLGFVVHVPHYLAQGDYPTAAVALLEKLELGARITIDSTELRDLAEQASREVVEYLADNEEVAEVVAGLERQYDAFNRSAESGANLLELESDLPTGDELGLQFEEFLANLDRREED
jgi:hypothetical protein